MVREFTLIVMSVLGAAALAAPAVAQTVAFEQRVETDGTTTLVHEVQVPAAPEDVWQAVSTPHGWTTWAVPLAWIDPAAPDHMETAYDPAAAIGDPGNIRQQILAQTPGSSFTFRTVKAPAGFPHAESYYRVTSEFTLTPQAGNTLVRLTTRGYAPDEAGTELVGFFTEGNAVTLGELARRFAVGPKVWTPPAAD